MAGRIQAAAGITKFLPDDVVGTQYRDWLLPTTNAVSLRTAKAPLGTSVERCCQVPASSLEHHTSCRPSEPGYRHILPPMDIPDPNAVLAVCHRSHLGPDRTHPDHHTSLATWEEKRREATYNVHQIVVHDHPIAYPGCVRRIGQHLGPGAPSDNQDTSGESRSFDCW